MLLCVLVLVLAASALTHPLDEATLDAQWEQWKITHRREYNGLVSVLSVCVSIYYVLITVYLSLPQHVSLFLCL